MNDENQIPEFFEEKDLFGQPKRQPVLSDKPAHDTPEENESPYADFGSRLVAYILDALILLLPVQLIRGLVFDNFDFSAKGPSQTLFELFLWTLYFGQTESSIKQASLGKRICKIKVVDANGQRVSFLRASLRFLATSISFLVVGLGIISILVNKKRQGWHDILTGCYVIKDRNNAA